MYSCTSNGALRRTALGDQPDSLDTQLATLPMRLAEFRLASDGKTFAYAGDEVELSVWDVQRAFSTPSSVPDTTPDTSTTKKRKRNAQLLPGELWRAKNVC